MFKEMEADWTQTIKNLSYSHKQVPLAMFANEFNRVGCTKFSECLIGTWILDEMKYAFISKKQTNISLDINSLQVIFH